MAPYMASTTGSTIAACTTFQLSLRVVDSLYVIYAVFVPLFLSLFIYEFFHRNKNIFIEIHADSIKRHLCSNVRLELSKIRLCYINGKALSEDRL